MTAPFSLMIAIDYKSNGYIDDYVYLLRFYWMDNSNEWLKGLGKDLADSGAIGRLDRGEVPYRK